VLAYRKGLPDLAQAAIVKAKVITKIRTSGKPTILIYKNIFNT
jgi:hypothetical protein